MGLAGAPQDGIREPGEAVGDFRRCLRPSACPYAQAGPLPVASPKLWGATLAELLPGDPDLAWEIAGLLIDEGVLGDDELLGTDARA